MDLKSGLPLWLIKYGLPFDYPVLEKDTAASVLIMGAGISGALVAFYLLEAGFDCIMIDGRTVGLGSTCASTSLLQYEIDVPLSELQHKIGLQNAVKAYKYCEDAIFQLESISNKIGFKDFQKKQSLYYAATKKDDAFIEKEFCARKENGFDVKLLGEREIAELFHFKCTRAILSEKAAQTNAYNFTHALHQYNLKRGLKIYDRTQAINIKHSKNGVLVKTDKGVVIKAGRLIYATGYEAVKYIDKSIVKLHSTYAICSEQMKPDEPALNVQAVLWNTSDPYLYQRSTIDNRIIIGGRDESFYNPEKRDKLLPEKTVQLEKDFKKLFPQCGFKQEFAWTGTFGSTKDGLPFIGEYKKLPNGYFALGFGGNGITFSLIAAEVLINLFRGIKGNANEMFSFDRV
jgi:glycine/D-amino acid oxidase-like deaminating enzyme